MAFVPFFAIAGAGREAGPSGAEHDEVLAIAHARHATPAQIRLAWALQRGPHVLVIPGTGAPTTSPTTSPPQRCGSHPTTWLGLSNHQHGQ